MSHANISVDLSDRNVELGPSASIARTACLAVGVIGLIVAVLLGFMGNVAWHEFWKSWLQTWIFVLEISLGCLFFVFIQHLRHRF